MAESRTEDLFIALIKGTKKDFEPQSRFESYMKSIINKTDPAETPKPESRKDVLMKTYAEQVYNGGGGGGGGSSVQADYNQNDSTAADYIKNRPFYAGGTDYTLIRNNAVYEQNSDMNNIYITPLFDSEEDMVQLPLKDTINVNWGGKIYTCQMKMIEDAAVFGNAHLFDNSQVDNGDPFVILAESDGSIMILYILGVKNEQDEQNTFSIVVKDANYVKKISSKFLPSAKEMIAAEEEAGTFSVPKPSNSTDLTDKNYVDNFVVATGQGPYGDRLTTLMVGKKKYTLPQLYLHDVSYSGEEQELHFSFYTMNSQRAQFLSNFINEGVSLTCPGYIIFKLPNSQGFEAKTYQILRITRGSGNYSSQVKVTVFKENELKDYILPGADTLSDNVYSFPDYYYID